MGLEVMSRLRGVSVMSTQEWKQIEECLKSFYSPVKIKCDGYYVTLCLRRLDQFKNGILIYVNGEIKGKWLLEDCEERRRFFRPVKKSLYSRKQKASLKKISKRLRQKAGLSDPEINYTCYYPYWKSFRALKTHIIKNNSDIELELEQTETVDMENN